jgi:hypothetical protein
MRFIKVMADLTNSLDPQEISAPIQRGLSALSKLGIHEDDRAFQAGSFPVGYDRISLAEDGSLKIENSMVTPNSTSQDEVHELSPYNVLNTILWGVYHWPHAIVELS